ncbi:MAG: carboxypeptidase-like regulatory domain-containing protein, partial [Bacteroidia bacterium]|nr:carboxypeptidase-like regulatory domain-containing protein [Bacteroidia bacterium]
MKKTTLLIFLLLFSGFAFSQVTTSNIKGLVLDENSEPLPVANIVAVHVPTGTTYGAATNFDGRYNLLN